MTNYPKNLRHSPPCVLLAYLLHVALSAQSDFLPAPIPVPFDHCETLGTGAIIDFESTGDALFLLQERTGCFAQSLNDPLADCQLVYSPEGRVSMDGLIRLGGHPYLVLDGHRLLDLLDTSRSVAFAAPQLSNVLAPTCYLGTEGREILLGTANDGLFLFRPQPDGSYPTAPERISTAGGRLPSNRVQALYEDGKGTIWIGTDAGLAAYHQDSVYNLSRPREVNGLTRLLRPRLARPAFEESVTAISQWYGSLLVAGPGHVHKMNLTYDSIRFLHRYPLEERLPEPLEAVYGMTLDGNGNIWVAGNQLFCFNITNDQLTLVPDNRAYRSSQARRLFFDPSSEVLWVGQERRGLYRIPVEVEVARALLPEEVLVARGGGTAEAAAGGWRIAPNRPFYATELFSEETPSSLTEKGERYLNMLAQELLSLKAHGQFLKLHITGHVARRTDLDEQRLREEALLHAEGAKSYLVKLGISPELIQTWTAGSQLVNEDCTANPLARCNNRLEFIVHMRP